MTQSCCGFAGLLFGHKFIPRYDEHEEYPKDIAQRLETALARLTPKTIPLEGDVDAMDQVRRAFRDIGNSDSFYIQDVCQRCGLIVERPPDPVSSTDTDELLLEVISRMEEAGPFQRAQLRDLVQQLTNLIKKRDEPKTEIVVKGDENVTDRDRKL